MRSDRRRTFSMAARALGFAVANPSSDASYTSLVAQLKDRLDQAGDIAVQQNDGTSNERGAITQRMKLRRTLEGVMLPHLIRVAEMAAESHPELVNAFIRPRYGAPARTLIAAARSLEAAAVANKDLLLSFGLGDTFLDTLAAVLGQYDALTDAAHAGRRAHVSARAELDVLGIECARLVRILDGIFRARFADDPQSLATWESSRNLPGPFARHVEAPVPAPTPASALFRPAVPEPAPVEEAAA